MTETPDQAMTDIEDELLGEGLDPNAAWHLARAAESYQDDDAAERHLRRAAALAPGHPATLIGIYRFYFYKCRLREALEVGKACLACAADRLGMPRNWHHVRSENADFGDYGQKWPRFYLFTLKACAYLQLRIGEIDEGQAAIAKLLELEPTDKVGAMVLQRVLERRGHEDED